MPILHKSSVDEHLYIKRAFSGETDDPAHVTYQVGPRGENIFDRFTWRDGDEIEDRLFHALLLDGGIFHPRVPENVSVYDLPERFWPKPSETDTEFTKLLKSLALTPNLSFKTVVDLVDEITTEKKIQTAKRHIEFAASLFLAAKKQEESDRDRHGI